MRFVFGDHKTIALIRSLGVRLMVGWHLANVIAQALFFGVTHSDIESRRPSMRAGLPLRQTRENHVSPLGCRLGDEAVARHLADGHRRKHGNSTPPLGGHTGL